MAKDVGYILLPAFNSSTGIPYPRVNLRYGLKSHGLASTLETCTACAGTMILEFAALSRLTGEPIFEVSLNLSVQPTKEFIPPSSKRVLFSLSHMPLSLPQAEHFYDEK